MARLSSISGLAVWGASRCAIRASRTASVRISTSGSSAPILFTSDAEAPAPGDWLGLNFDVDVALTTLLENVDIGFAGAMDTGARSYSCGSPPAPAMYQQQTMGAVYLTLANKPSMMK
jgi:hypothetical protein